MPSPEQPSPDDPAGHPAAGGRGADGAPARERRARRTIWLLAAIPVVALLALFVVRLAAPASGDPAKVEDALKGSTSTFLAGTGEPAALAAATCKADGDDEYLCTPKGLPEAASIRLVLAEDGSLTERLAGDPDPASLRSGDGIASALAADARARGLGEPEYACGTSIRMSPEGATEPGNAAGFLCVAKPSGGAGSGGAAAAGGAGSRYVELSRTADGTLARDYAIRTK